MEFQEPVKERFTYNSSQGISKMQIRFSECRGSSVRKGVMVKAGDIIILYFKGN
jgi:hypothetical protein